MIKIKNLEKVHKNGFKALKKVNLHVGKNEFIYLVGPSGAGKTTLLNMIFKFDTPTSGEIFIDNCPLSSIHDRQIPHLRRNIGVVFQDFKLLPKRTVYENIAFALKVMHYSRANIRRKVSQVLDLVGLTQKESYFPNQLSGGEKQRICIARAIVNDPPILLADEPTGSLDPDTSWEIMHLLSKINARNTTVIVATHNKGLVDDLRKRVVTLESGKIIRDQQIGFYQ